MNPVTTRLIKSSEIGISFPAGMENEDWVVWWYGGIIKNNRDGTVPKVIVYFRKLDEGNILGKAVSFPVALTHLGILRIGSVWKKGACHSEVVLTTKRVVVDFSNGAWSFVSHASALRNENPSPVKKEDYPLQSSYDESWMLDFPLKDDQNLLIPCLEFFSRFYGRSQELKRVLTTYPWGTAEGKIFGPDEEPPSSNRWPINLGRDLYKSDAVIAAHIKYDSYARRAAKSIYAELEASYEREKRAFIKIRPWFEGMAMVAVEGISTNDGRTFLGLRITGGSDPEGVLILRDKVNTSLVEEPADEADGTAWNGAPSRVMKEIPEIVLTDNDSPDHGSSTIEVHDPTFSVLGEPRKVIDKKRPQAKSSAGKPAAETSQDTFSSGERTGTNKGVGKASIHACQEMESQGVLRDIWNAVCHLQKEHPKTIQAVEWFTREDGFNATEEPKLISLNALSLKEDVSSEIKSWVYADSTKTSFRGVLVVRLIVNSNPVFLVEIQRRTSTKKDDEGNEIVSEQAFKLLAFTLDEQSKFDKWIEKLLEEIPKNKGIVRKLVGLCPGNAIAINHSRSKTEVKPQEKTLQNALEKLGIDLK